jgi:hypothetical protein
VLPLYEEMFKIEFPLPKLDTLIAADFDAGVFPFASWTKCCSTDQCIPGAMENWVNRNGLHCLSHADDVLGFDHWSNKCLLH